MKKFLVILFCISVCFISCAPSAKSLANQYASAYKSNDADKMDEISGKAKELGIYSEFENEVQQKRLW